MKITAKALRRIIDTLPNPMEQRMRERRVVIMPNIYDIGITTSQCPPYITEDDEIKFTLNNYGDEWELEINADRELVKSLRFQLKEENGISTLWKQEHIDLNKKYLLLMNQHDWLHKKWFVKLYFKYHIILIHLKKKLNNALHRFTWL